MIFFLLSLISDGGGVWNRLAAEALRRQVQPVANARATPAQARLLRLVSFSHPTQLHPPISPALIQARFAVAIERPSVWLGSWLLASNAASRAAEAPRQLQVRNVGCSPAAARFRLAPLYSFLLSCEKSGTHARTHAPEAEGKRSHMRQLPATHWYGMVSMRASMPICHSVRAAARPPPQPTAQVKHHRLPGPSPIRIVSHHHLYSCSCSSRRPSRAQQKTRRDGTPFEGLPAL
jgi:hypothetical protein